MARRVHGERSVGLLYGQRALLIGALEPLTYTGTMLSTNAGDQPFKRLARTAKIQETVFLGTREEADKALAAVHRLHERIKGELPEAAGAHPAGAAYSAFDPELMLWTLAVIADSGRAMYETMVRPLSDERARGALAGLRPLRRALRPAARARSRPATPSSAPGSTANSPRPTCTRPQHALEMAPLVAFRQPVPLPAAANLGDPEPDHQGDAAAARARDLRHPLDRRPRDRLPLDHRRPPPRPPGDARASCAAAATTTSSTSSPSARSAAAAPALAAGRTATPPDRHSPRLSGCSSCSPSRRPGPRRGRRTRSPAPAR